MATVYVSIGQAGHLSHGRNPVFTGKVRTETISSSGTNAEGSLEANKGDVAKVQCASAIIVQSGSAASASAGQYLAANEVGWIGMVAGEKINVIDA